jgi:hypothetical protein
MSEGFATPPPPAPASRVRPATVTAATWLLLLVAVTLVASAVLAFSQAGTIADVYREAYAGTDIEDSTDVIAAASSVGGGLFSLLLAAGFVVLALLDHRGKNPARIVTWVLGGVGLCCVGGGLALTGLTSGIQMDTADGPDPAEVQRMLDDALPAWYSPVSLTLTIAALLALVLALILLALPPSNAFFRKPTQAVEPPPGYPPVG